MPNHSLRTDLLLRADLARREAEKSGDDRERNELLALAKLLHSMSEGQIPAFLSALTAR